MEVGILSMRYAKALMGYAQEKGVEDKLYQELVTLSDSFRTQPRLREALDNPILPVKEKHKLLCTAASGNKAPSDTFTRFINLVLEHRR